MKDIERLDALSKYLPLINCFIEENCYDSSWSYQVNVRRSDIVVFMTKQRSISDYRRRRLVVKLDDPYLNISKLSKKLQDLYEEVDSFNTNSRQKPDNVVDLNKWKAVNK